MSCVGVISWNQFGRESAAGATPGKAARAAAVRKAATLETTGSEARRNYQTVGGTEKSFVVELGVNRGQETRRQETRAAGNDRSRQIAMTSIEERRLEVDWAVLVRRCLDGDSAAWAELVKAQHRRIYSLCYRFTGSSSDAEDLTQEVFLKVYGNLASFDLSRGSFPTWLTTLTRNLLVDHFRKSRQQRSTDSIDAGWEDSSELQISDRLADPQPSPHQHAAAREIERMVQQALTKISPELREAVILRDLQDLDYKEIAQVLHIPEGTVKSRISRGRAELARLLERNKRQVV